jgi:hypothetical protein
VENTVRNSILDGNVAMVDLTACLANMEKPRYIDPTHYSRFANQVIAKAVYRHTHAPVSP